VVELKGPVIIGYLDWGIFKSKKSYQPAAGDYGIFSLKRKKKDIKLLKSQNYF